MRFIPIAKAKPKFEQKYLVTDGTEVDIATLESSTNTKGVLQHRFGSDVVANPTHIAAIDLPGAVVAPGAVADGAGS